MALRPAVRAPTSTYMGNQRNVLPLALMLYYSIFRSRRNRIVLSTFDTTMIIGCKAQCHHQRIGPTNLLIAANSKPQLVHATSSHNRSIAWLPMEIRISIFSLAGVDERRTGCSLSQVFKYFQNASAPFCDCSVAIKGLSPPLLLTEKLTRNIHRALFHYK